MSTTTNPAEVRAWARANGITVGKRGRLSADLVKQYRDAMWQAAVTRYETGSQDPA